MYACCFSLDGRASNYANYAKMAPHKSRQQLQTFEKHTISQYRPKRRKLQPNLRPSVRPSARLLVCSSLISFPTPLVYDRPICLSVRLSLILSRCPFVPSSVCLSMRLHLFLPHACTQRIVSHCIMYNKRIITLYSPMGLWIALRKDRRLSQIVVCDL